ncbi:guanylate kinase [Limnobacter thiooxidans]|uniref:Guanylate kinase n=1 Tax=Limnobacter thiooxidans TaxID=131080 RepID=A0AA86JJH8_9BURK|nr:guanylate kinase [Limnobacter sp.]MCZ8015898.1 guanylate kinase [Limnobacter sp.]RZS42980.1 guanylate kinase [Limnobacter thiooxidans]BET25582.1 guanylate kinase [Limnobacter thiooxidans]
MSKHEQPARKPHYSGSLFIVSAPSGAGKSSLVKALLAEVQGVGLSISNTTRKARIGEVDGKDYHFISQTEFETIRDEDGFLEWAHVHGNYYGTSRSWVENQMAIDRDVLLEIDWQGAEQVVRKVDNVVSIFILPPSMEELEKRLRGRGTDSEEVILKRMGAAQREIEQATRFDYVILNDDFTQALLELKSIVFASRCRFNQQMARHGAQLKSIGL